MTQSPILHKRHRIASFLTQQFHLLFQLSELVRYVQQYLIVSRFELFEFIQTRNVLQ